MTPLERQLAASITWAQQQKRNAVRQALIDDTEPMLSAERDTRENDMTQAIEVHRPSSALASRLEFSEPQQQMIYSMYAKGAGREEFAVLMEIASARRLNPLLKQIHFVKRWDSRTRTEVWAAQASIDGLRAIAERTGKYDGQDEPEYEERAGKVVKAIVRVYRKDWSRAAVGVAYWDEYVQKTKEGAPTRFWQQMPHVMLAKCAEALALRKAFPEDMSGLYVPEEMSQAENAPVQSLPRITPHDPEDFNPVGHNPPELLGMIQMAEDFMAAGQLAEARAVLGSKAKPRSDGSATLAIQLAKEAGHVTADYAKELGKNWQRVNRQLEKRETVAPKPADDVVASFIDGDDDDNEREPGED